MNMTRAELIAAAEKAFAGRAGASDAADGWRIVSEMGWLGLCVPEDRGGLGLGMEARAVIHHALGGALVPGPMIAQMVVVDALSKGARGQEADALLAAAIAGEPMTASLALHEGDGGDWMQAAPDADRASHVLRIGKDQVALVPMDACEVHRRETWDETRRLFDVRVRGLAGLILAEGKAACSMREMLRINMLFSLAADAVGGAHAALAMTVEHLGTRRQFDRPLAMFQALKHRCADLRMKIGLAEALLWQEAADGLSLTRAGAIKAQACRVYAETAEEAIQLHGGMGLTMEHPCHLFLKRAFLNAELGGNADYWEERAGRERLADYGKG